MSEERKPDKPVKGRKNGLYRGISEELEDGMRRGWSDTERRDLEPSEQIRASLTPSGSPQMLLELGVVRTSRPTARRPAGDLTTDG